MYNWFSILKPGKWTGNTKSGLKEVVFTDSDVEDIRNATANGADVDIPIVIGHPTIESAKWGSVPKNAFRIQDGELQAQPSELHEDFVSWVKAKLYDRVSISLRPNNTIKHIGFLGGTPPAVKGLPAAAFSDDDIFVEYTEGGEMDEQTIEGLSQSVFEKVKGYFTKKEDDVPNTVPDLSKDVAELTAKFSEIEVSLETVTKERDALKAANLDREKAEKESRKTEAHAKNVAFAETLVGKIKEDQKDMFVEVLDAIDTVVDFSEGEGETAVKFKTFLSELKDSVEFGEIAKKDGHLDLSDSSKVDALVKAKMKEDGELDYGQALLIVSREHNVS